jgi:hypothetical protein
MKLFQNCKGRGKGIMLEKTFRKSVINKLKEKRITVLDLGNTGTFDLFIDGTNSFFLELKIITKAGKRGFKIDPEGPSFAFTEKQSHTICKMKFPIYLLAKYDNDYFLFDSKWVKKNVKKLIEYHKEPTAIIYEFRWKEQNVPPITYDEAIHNLEKIVKKRQRI